MELGGPVGAPWFVPQGLGAGGVADAHETVVARLEGQTGVLPLAGAPRASVEADVHGEGKPGLHPARTAAELGRERAGQAKAVEATKRACDVLAELGKEGVRDAGTGSRRLVFHTSERIPHGAACRHCGCGASRAVSLRANLRVLCVKNLRKGATIL